MKITHQLRRIISGSIYRSNEAGFSDLLLYGKMIAEGVILQTDGSFLSAFWFRGKDLETSSDEELSILSKQINNAFNLIGSGWLFHIDTIRNSATGYIKPTDCNFSHQLSRLIDEERSNLYNQAQLHYENYYVISFTYKPKLDLTNKFSKFFSNVSNNTNKPPTNFSYHLKFYTDKLAELIELLAFNLKLTAMSSVDLIIYLSYCLSGENIQLQLPKKCGVFLKAFLATKDVLSGDNPKIGDKYLRAVTIMGFPTESYAGILDKLNYLNFEYRLNTRFIILDQYHGRKIIDRLADLWYQKRLSVTDSVKMSLAIDSNIKINHNANQQYLDAQDALTINDSGENKFGYYTATVILLNEDLTLVEQQAKEVRGILRNLGFQSQIERYHSLEAYLGSLPGYAYANIRKWLIHTQNVADLIPNTSVWSGLNTNPCKLYSANAPVLFYANTTGSTPLRLSLHVGDNGHTLILGPTGSGKSTLLNFIMVQHLRYSNAQVFMFDKNRSALPLCYGLAGDFFDIGSSVMHHSFFQPLANLESDADFAFANLWLEELCRLNGMKDIFNDTHRKAIYKALMLMRSEISKDRRNISYFRYLVHDYDQLVAGVLNEFSSELSLSDVFNDKSGFISRIFDATTNKFDNNNSFTVFEMSRLIELGDRIIVPALSYLIYVINKKVMHNRPTLIVFDESFIFFKHELFRTKIIEWLKTMRKFNVAIIFATQELEDLFQYPDLISSLKNNCATKIYLPNPRATSSGLQEKYLDMGLNTKQVSLLANMLRGEYFYTSNLGNKKFNLNIDSTQLVYAFVARTSNDDINHAREIYNNDSKNFITNWYDYSKQIG
jgi:type IV secretion system protein VirB4